MSIRINLDIDPGLDRLFREIKDASEEATVRTANFALRSASQLMKQEIRQGIKTGRVYGTHQASAPGEAPADDTGELASSITFKEATALSFGVLSVNAPYAGLLEFGGVNSENRYVAPRPFFYPALNKAMNRAIAQFAKEFNKL